MRSDRLRLGAALTFLAFLSSCEPARSSQDIRPNHCVDKGRETLKELANFILTRDKVLSMLAVAEAITAAGMDVYPGFPCTNLSYISSELNNTVASRQELRLNNLSAAEYARIVVATELAFYPDSFDNIPYFYDNPIIKDNVRLLRSDAEIRKRITIMSER